MKRANSPLPKDRERRGERGVALLLALLTMVLLTVLVVEFTFSTQVQYRRAAMWVAGRRAELIAEAGLELAAEVLAEDYRLTNTDSPADLWARALPPINTGAGMLTVRIEDEQGKLNLNALSTGALSPPGRRYQALLDRLHLDHNLAFPLADWVDKNREAGPSPLAAEDEYYGSIAPPAAPYTTRNGPLHSFAELALVRGYTPPVLAALRCCVTAFPDSELHVNVNTAPPAVLAAMDPRLEDESIVKRIVEVRAQHPFSSASALRLVEGMQDFQREELERMFSFQSQWFRVRSTGDVDGAMRSVEALVARVNGKTSVVYLLPRLGPNIVGADSAIRARLDDGSLFGERRP